MSDAVAEALELADELAKQGGEQDTQMSKNFTSVALSTDGHEVVLLSASLKKACKEPVSDRVELDALRAADELGKFERNVALANV